MKYFDKFLMLIFLFLSFQLACQDYDIYVSGANSDNILKYDQNGENREVFISQNSGGLDWPQDIVFLEDQNIALVSSLNTGQVKSYNAQTGEYIDNFITLTSGAGPTRMAIGSDGLLYVLQWGNASTAYPVLRYNLDGTLFDEFGETSVIHGIGLAWDENNNLYVSSYGPGRIHKYGPDGEDMGLFINSNLAGPVNIWFEENGEMLVMDYNAGNIKRFSPEGEYQGVFIPGLNAPEGVAFLPDGNFLIGNGNTNQVRLYDPMTGELLNNLIEDDPNLSTPNAVVLRNLDDVAVFEPIAEKGDFVFPTIGNEFHLKSEFLNEVKAIEIYDVFGKKIEQKTFSGNPFWRTNEISDGTYLIVFENKNGQKLSQKIIVNH